MRRIVNCATVTSSLDDTFQLIFPSWEGEAFPDFLDSCTVITQQSTNFTVMLRSTLTLTTFPRWQPDQLSSHSFSRYASLELLSVHCSALIQSA